MPCHPKIAAQAECELETEDLAPTIWPPAASQKWNAWEISGEARNARVGTPLDGMPSEVGAPVRSLVRMPSLRRRSPQARAMRGMLTSASKLGTVSSRWRGHDLQGSGGRRPSPASPRPAFHPAMSSRYGDTGGTHRRGEAVTRSQSAARVPRLTCWQLRRGRHRRSLLPTPSVSHSKPRFLNI